MIENFNTSSTEAITRALGMRIRMIDLVDDILHILFENGDDLRIRDDAQYCCEYRHLSCDDDLSYYAGSTFLGAEISEVKEEVDDYENHEMHFLKITTSKGVFTVCTHNKHNGYYGGFDVCAHLVKNGEGKV